MRTTRPSLLILGLSLAVAPVAMAAEDPAAVYTAQCAKCHGETGQADTPAGKAMKAAKLAGDAKIAGMSVADIAASIKANEKHKTFAGKLTPEQLTAAATKAKELAGAK